MHQGESCKLEPYQLPTEYCVIINSLTTETSSPLSETYIFTFLHCNHPFFKFLMMQSKADIPVLQIDA